jgi:geranylgeranyl diphosphate synthase type II
VSVAAAGADSKLVAATLAADGRRTREALLDHLCEQASTRELHELVLEYPLRPAKGLRPALCLATCRAHGGRTEDALAAAVAIELLHNAFLVHDDICDDARLRRGADALHVRHGVPRALSAGDALAWAALGPLLDGAAALGRPGLAFDLLAEFDHLTRRTIDGHAAELGWRERGVTGLDPDGYLRLVLDKTCWYSSIHPCRIGALLGSRGRADLEPFARFGFFLGAVLQIRDDVENLTDRSETHGKDFGSDVIEGKPTLILVHLLETPAGSEARALVGPAGDRTGAGRDERIERFVELAEDAGSIEYACAFADGLSSSAVAALQLATAGLSPSRDVAFLRAVVLYLCDPAVRGR